MKMLHDTCVIASLDGDDPWQTERRSSGWIVGDASPNPSDTLQPTDDPWRTERRSSDWNVGDAPPDDVDSGHLALAPVENSRSQFEGADPVVASVLTYQRIAELLQTDDGSPRADRVVAQ
jgi:hypothetical protein